MISLSLILFILFDIFLKYNCILSNDDINTHLMTKVKMSSAQTITPIFIQRNKRSIRQLEEDVDNDISKSKEDTHLFDPNISDLQHFKIDKQKEDEYLKQHHHKNYRNNDNHNNNINHNISLPNEQQKAIPQHPLTTPNSIVNPNAIEKRKISVPVYRETASGFPAMTMFGEESPVRIAYREMDSNELQNDDNNGENNINNNNNVVKNINDDIAKNINDDIFRNVDNSIASNIKPIDFQFTTEISNDFISHDKKENRADNTDGGTTYPSVVVDQQFADKVNQVNHKPQSSYMHIVHHTNNNNENNYNNNNYYNNQNYQTFDAPANHQNRNNYQSMHYRAPSNDQINLYQRIYNSPANTNRYHAPEKLPSFSFSNQIKHKLLNDYRQDDNYFTNDDNTNSIRREHRQPVAHYAANPTYDRTLYRQTVSHPTHHNSYYVTAPRMNAVSSVSSTTISPYDQFTRKPNMMKQQQQQHHDLGRIKNPHTNPHKNRLNTRYWRPLLPEETYNIFSKILQNNKNPRILEPKLQIQTNTARKEQKKYFQNVAQSSPKLDQIAASTQMEEQFGARISTKQRDNVRADQRSGAAIIERHSLQTTTSSSVTTTTISATMPAKLLRPTRRPLRNYNYQPAPAESKFFTIGATLNF